ncbi:MAG TPA: SgcJ/EcaC family oxidoreductase [Thermoanaerobaculia bacterium]|nr:SgcJ/EcaC family oxidoreductase [Thermoanaerobaculia bacterium]
MARFLPTLLSLALVSSSAVSAPLSGTRRIPAPPAVAVEARTLLETQAAAWNRGDLDAFCAVYADDALFLTAFGLTKGREEVLARYKARYPDATARGTLSFDVLTVDVLAPAPAKKSIDAIGLIARWKISHADKPAAEGLTLLNLVRFSSGWRIVHDASM